MMLATKELEDIKNSSASMKPEDRVSRTMDLQEEIAGKVEIIEKQGATEMDLLPQGDKVPQDAQDFKDELNRIKTYILNLQDKVRTECDNFSEDVKYWAEYRTGIKEFNPWLESAEKASLEGLSKPTNLEESLALFAKVNGFDKACLDNPVTELNTWVAKDKTTEGENQFSLEKMESTL